MVHQLLQQRPGVQLRIGCVLQPARIHLLSVLCLLCTLCLCTTALAYPNQGKTYDVTRPDGRDYFPSDITDLPVSEGLNDLFQFLNPDLGTDGHVVTARDWEARRAEIADLIQYYYLGYKQPTSPENVSVRQYLRITPGYWEFTSEGFRIVPDDIHEVDEPFYGDDTQTGGMYITITNPDTGVSADIYVSSVYVPRYTESAELAPAETNIPGPYPVILGMGGSISANARSEVLKRGYAIVNLNTGSVYSDSPWNDGSPDGNAMYRSGVYTTLYPFDPEVYEYNSGALMGWAWGMSRVIDAIAGGAYDGVLDATRTLVTGVSRNGKAALIAAAFDERICICTPSDPGQTGSASYRYTNQAQLFSRIRGHPDPARRHRSHRPRDRWHRRLRAGGCAPGTLHRNRHGRKERQDRPLPVHEPLRRLASRHHQQQHQRRRASHLRLHQPGGCGQSGDVRRRREAGNLRERGHRRRLGTGLRRQGRDHRHL